MTAGQFTRARSVEAKQTRETAILDAATLLATERGVRAVTLTDIAAAVGMHKSTMLRYFETREEIFLRLAAAAWTSWADDVLSRLGAEELEPGDAVTDEMRIAAVVSVVVDTLTERPLFCDLLAQTPLNLERGVSYEAVRTLKVPTVAAVRAVAEGLTRALPISTAAARDVVAVATSMAGAFWHMAAAGTGLRRFYEETPELAHSVVDVGPRLTSVLTALLRGSESARND